eukprot:12494548-Alexandrium_andersonii.AAC.1
MWPPRGRLIGKRKKKQRGPISEATTVRMDAEGAFSMNSSFRAGRPCVVPRVGHISENALRCTQGDLKVRMEAIAGRANGTGAGGQVVRERVWECKLCGERVCVAFDHPKRDK